LGKMGSERIFVGRQGELERFREVLKNPKGQAILVVGQAGMGKTWLVDKMGETGVSGEDYAVRQEAGK